MTTTVSFSWPQVVSPSQGEFCRWFMTMSAPSSLFGEPLGASMAMVSGRMRSPASKRTFNLKRETNEGFSVLEQLELLEKILFAACPDCPLSASDHHHLTPLISYKCQRESKCPYQPLIISWGFHWLKTGRNHKKIAPLERPAEKG